MFYLIILTLLILSVIFLYGRSKGIEKERLKQIKNNNKLKAKYEKIKHNDIDTVIDKLHEGKY